MRITLCLLLCECILVPGLAQAQPPETPAESIVDEPACDSECHPLEVRGEYLIWWLREGHVPPLLTTSSFASQGRLGQPDTQVLYGDDRLETRHNDRFNGTRFTLSYMLNDLFGVEGNFIFLERDSTYFKAVSDGSQLLARPYINVLDGTAQSGIVAGPLPNGDVRSGGFVGYSRVELFTQEANGFAVWFADQNYRVDLLCGARFLEMRDRVDETAAARLLPAQTTLYGLSDHIWVHDFFWGGQLGVRGEATWDRWSLHLRGEAALGGDDQQVRAFGQRVYQTPVVRLTRPFGLAVLPSNSGVFQRTVLDAIYEITVNVGYQLTEHWQLFAGYTFLGWQNPIRAGDQIDVFVNPTQITGPLVGPARPAIPFKEEFFWAQGVNVGLEFRW
jgi:hypothetical protein